MRSPENEQSAGPGRRIPGRSFVTWSLGYGMARRFFASAAKKGDLIARLETDRALQLDPYEAYRELRARGPVAPGRVAWGTSSHEAVTTVLRSDAFGSGGGHSELPGPLAKIFGTTVDPWAASVVDPPSMLATDGAAHTRYRRLVSRAFTAKAISGLEESIRGVADRLLDDLEASKATDFDLVERYAALLPVAVIADMLGVPDSMHTTLLDWGDGAARTLDPTLSWRDFRAAEGDMRHLHRWLAQHIRDLRANPGDDLLSRLAVAQEDEQLTDFELRATGLLVLGAGFETTVSLISNAVQLMAEHPEQHEIVLAEPDLLGGAVDEVLRFDSPVQVTMRIAPAETEVLGTLVPARTPVLCYLGGANRDPEVFTDPDRFDVTRENAGSHLAFSSGAHFCLGASLARREAEVGLRALYERFPDLAVSAPPVRRPTRVLRGWENLHVTTQAPARARQVHAT
ncbi:MAG: cytochrome P450 [Nocardioides sp.]